MSAVHQSNPFKWPNIEIPNISLSRLILEKFIFNSNRSFLLDDGNNTNFSYDHVLSDILRMIQILKSEHVTDTSTVGILGSNNYEHVITLLAALVLEAKVVLLETTLSKEQISTVVTKCNITNLTVCANKSERGVLDRISNQYKNSYSISFGDKTNQNLKCRVGCKKSFLIDEVTEANHIHMGLNNFSNKSTSIKLMIPVFKKRKLIKVHYIKEYSLISQLTYVSLPQCGFNWNTKDVIWGTCPLFSLMGLLQLMATLWSGAQIVVNAPVPDSDHLEEFVNLISKRRITSCIVDSYYLVGLIKSNLTLDKSLQKVLFIGQPIHPNVIKVFKERFKIYNCRFVFYLLEASGCAAIEVFNHSNGTTNLVTPLPLMQVLILDRETGQTCSNSKAGKLFIRSKYCSRITDDESKPDDKWIFTGYIASQVNVSKLQVIDLYKNYAKLNEMFYSKSSMESLFLSQNAVKRVINIKHEPSSLSNSKPSLIVKVEISKGKQCNERELRILLKDCFNLDISLTTKSKSVPQVQD